MPTIKRSRQRDAIKNFLYSRHDHPTADIIYRNISQDFPNISLGTVYRNLAFLVEHGQAITVPCEDGSVHFDGNITPHNHFQCKSCNAILDFEVPESKGANEYFSFIKKHCNVGHIEGHVEFFYGICDKCIEKDQTESNE